MASFALTHPTATLSRGIENLVIYGEHSRPIIRGACEVAARIISIVVFPLFLLLELTFKRIPKMLMAIGTEKFHHKVDKSLKYLLAIIPSIFLGLHSPEGMPGFFLKRQKNTPEIRPFGVEKIFGKTIDDGIDYPTSIEDVQKIVQEAKDRKS